MGRFRVPPAGRREAGRGDAGRRDAGQVSSDYMGILVVLALVVAMLGAVLVFPGGSPIAGAIETGVCTIADLGCHGDDGSGSTTSTSGSGGQTSSGSDDTKDKDDGCHGFWGCTWSGIKTGASQVGSGVANIFVGAWDDVTGLVDLVAHPSKILDAGDYAIHHPLETLKQLIWDDKTGDMWDRGDYGGAIGREIWNIGSWFIPGVDIAKGVAKVGDLGRVAAKLAELAKLGEKASDAARAAEKAAARGDVAAAEAAAKEARKAADEAAEKAKAAGCPVALGIPRPGGGALLALGPEPGPALTLVQPAGPGLFSAPISAPVSAPVASLPIAGGCEAGDAAKKADADADAAEKAATEAAEKALNNGLGPLVSVAAKDPAAEALARKLGGQPSVKFKYGPDNEFDVVSDLYVAQTKPANFTLNQAFRNQAKTTFETAIKSGRTPYFHFEGPPGPGVLQALQRYADRYGIEPVIDTTPLN